ncbi:epithelial-stromal interaction protein 1 isoform X2 [Hemiscyllium ocellatum]|nr:epithelial-stromal interaction protein 1 isoform X2 [Hemiscyllium ocellatum]XP_060688832.1 epithelial-stromal interaction protein 1 isoform X2 [Hemiscyllium ocellatum]XP_060688833.1 epithelial-stromal interaction protein 1 isoform X2 [Hemiscyllium ocellatum]
MMANKELEDLRKWKEANRLGPINLTPMQLGGSTSEAEARQRQQLHLRESRFQKRSQKEDYNRKRKEAEELEYQKKKEIQREKANKLLEKQRQQEAQRKAQLQAEHQQANQQFLQRIEANTSYRHSSLPPNSTVPTTAWSKSRSYRETQREAELQRLQEHKDEQRRKSELAAEEASRLESERQQHLQEEHRKKNQAFLDNLERSRKSMENLSSSPAPLSDEKSFESQAMQCVPSVSLLAGLRETHQDNSDTAMENAAYRDSPEDTVFDWNLMKLQNCFPDYEPSVLEDLLLQCDSDYEKVIQLLQ